jgi:hypothetical protein
VAVYKSWFDGIEKSARGESARHEHEFFLNRKENATKQLLTFLTNQVSILPTLLCKEL